MEWTKARQIVFSKRLFRCCCGIAIGLLLFGCEHKPKQNDQSELLIDAMVSGARQYLDKGEESKAKAYFDSAFSSRTMHSPLDSMRRFLFLGGNYYESRQEPELAVATLDSIHDIWSHDKAEPRYLHLYILSLFLKGDFNFQLGNYKAAFKNYYDARMRIPEVVDPCSQGHHQYRLGMVYYRQGLFQDAKESFRKSFQLTANCTNDFESYALRQELLNNLALSFDQLNDMDSAIYYTQKSETFLQDGAQRFPSKDTYIKEAKAVLDIQESSRLEKNGHLKESLKHALKAQAWQEQKQVLNKDSQKTMMTLGRLYRKMHLADSANHWLNQLDRSLAVLPQPELKSELLSEVSRLKAANHQYEQAYQELTQVLERTSQKRNSLSNLQSFRLKDEFVRLDQEGLHQQLFVNNQYRTSWLVFILIITLFVVLGVILTVYYYRMAQKGLIQVNSFHQELDFRNWLLSTSLADLQVTNRQMDELIGRVASELHTPMLKIQEYGKYLVIPEPIDPEHQDMLVLMQQSNDKAVMMVEGLINIEKDDEEPFQSIELSALIQNCVDELKFSAQLKQLEIVIHAVPSLFAMAQPLLLSRAINNLISNAIKFSKPRKRIQVTLHQKKADYAQIEIRDEGIGIPPEMIDSIFDQPGNSNRAGTLGEESYGLGLSICKKIIQDHQGSIWVESEVGAFAQFIISLPLTKSS
ncbi:signal transduction histidine kinase [Dyadobacter jejuensis]|uniref:histidine kinase n=1 Tax=Dyadobacter jejuensis TaxID=1082580 RepID=A0A316B7U3_9BACT|nr:tetratricopeptide repeat-containing sensor histidine kinase [Dyadobacter jejuensis]PWJ58677.1 signal transduction histidine kinase [Dyadobacter jejuensis]